MKPNISKHLIAWVFSVCTEFDSCTQLSIQKPISQMEWLIPSQLLIFSRQKKALHISAGL